MGPNTVTKNREFSFPGFLYVPQVLFTTISRNGILLTHVRSTTGHNVQSQPVQRLVWMRIYLYLSW